MKGLKLEHYDEVNDIIEEALSEVCGFTEIISRTSNYDETIDDIVFEDEAAKALSEMCGITDIRVGISNLDKDVEYVCGTINRVKLGDKPNTLKHKINDIWTEDVDQTTTNYMDATYYRADQLESLVEKHLTRKHYNNDFLHLD